ncbi:hypothetical protein [Prosthecobacter sp.]|uniref:hypothetical protein n=1 Tax=Prosthecobacter sp. TaxID=1965333 RepID=UPI002ABBACA7|nr:hypothetical protein [Prosthecobacter sp.]MDZ4402145.1 hypothetical protein [Prosthecobacter sp.]
MPLPLTWDSSSLTYDSSGLIWDGTAPTPNPHTTMDNRISATLSPTDKATILTKVGEIQALLPFLLNLTTDEKSALPKMSAIRDGMDEVFAQEMAAHPELVPGFVDMTELAKDRALRTPLRDLHQQICALCEGIEDTLTAAGVDTYMAYLSFYNNVKQAAKRNVPGANTVHENLKRFFPRGGGSTPTPPAPPTP